MRTSIKFDRTGLCMIVVKKPRWLKEELDLVVDIPAMPLLGWTFTEKRDLL